MYYFLARSELLRNNVALGSVVFFCTLVRIREVGKVSSKGMNE